MKNKTNCKHQLRAFYAAQGLTGKHLRSAMRHDMRRIRKYSNKYPELVGGWLLSFLFLFEDTPEGYNYWRVRDDMCREGRYL